MSHLKQIKDVVKNHDVRDPNGALIAIEKILAERKASRKAVEDDRGVKCFDLKVFATEHPADDGLHFTVVCRHPAGAEQTLRAARAAGKALNDLAEKLAGDALEDLMAKVQL